MPSRSTYRLFLLPVLALSACGPDYDPAHPGVGLVYGTEEQAATVCAKGTTAQGIDVSFYQGTIDWFQVAASGRKFGYAKATEGTGIQDGTFATNFAGMKAQGMLRGAYHFLRASVSGTAQADYFLAFAGGASGLGELPPMLDWEVADGVSASQNAFEAQAFIAEIKAKTGRSTLIYTDPGFWSSIGSPGQFASSPLWVANWGASCPAVPSPWSSWMIWQYDDKGSVPGISGAVDLDQFNGSLAQLEQFAGVTAPLTIAQQSGNDAITAVDWPDGHEDVFAKSPAGAEFHVSTSAAGAFGTAATLDTGAACGSAAAFWGAPWSYPELWSPLSAGGTGHLWYTSGSGWNKYQPLGGSGLSHFATLVGLDGRSEVFALGADGAIWHDFWDLGKSAWSGWQSLGGSFSTGPATVVWSNGTGELFAADAAGDLWHSWSGTGTGYSNGWYAWTKMTKAGGGIVSRPSAVRWADGHAQVFARGADGNLYTSDFSTQNGWPALSAVGGAGPILGNPSAVMNVSLKGAAPGPEVFARDATGHVVHLWWNGSSYSAFQPLGDEVAASDPLGWIRGDGTTEVFAVDTNGNLVHALHDPTSGWSAWSVLSAGVDPCAPPLPGVDAGVPSASDGGEADGAGTIVPDAGEAAFDGGAEADSGEPVDAGAITPLHVSGGCGCGTGAGPDAAFALLLLPLFATRRRFRRFA